MKELAYRLLQQYIQFGLYCYFQEIELDGIEKMRDPWPTLVLPNHQNALLDPLIIAAHAPRKPWFLTRSDVFAGPRLRRFFSFLQMMPVYRIRDGRETLGRNKQVFRECSRLLAAGQAIVLFPEANHNLERRVRPLSKGFTRIIFETLESVPDLPVRILPVGLNYQLGDGFPDRARFIFGDPLEVREYLVRGSERDSVHVLKEQVASALKLLTVHIPHSHYKSLLSQLETAGCDFTRPEEVNAKWPELPVSSAASGKMRKRNLWDYGIEAINFPVVLVWRALLKPRVPEPEFMATYRFGFALLVYPLFYLLLFILLGLLLGAGLAALVTIFHFGLNLLYVKVR